MKRAFLVLALFGSSLGVGAALKPGVAVAAPNYKCAYCYASIRCARGTVGGTGCFFWSGFCVEVGECEQE